MMAIGAGLASAALYEVLEDIRATPHTRQFARALERGTVLVWVRAPDAEHQRAAAETLARFGAAYIHTHRRDADRDERTVPGRPHAAAEAAASVKQHGRTKRRPGEAGRP